MAKYTKVRFQGKKEINAINKNKMDNVITRRYYIIIGILLVLSTILIFRIVNVQVKQKNYYEAKLIQYNSDLVYSDANRGIIYDRNGVKLAYNSTVNCATYYAVDGISDADIDVMINFLIKNVNVDISDVTTRDKKDYLIVKDPDYVDSLITDEEYDRYKNEDDYDSIIYNLKIDRITEDILNDKMSDYDVQYYKLYYAISNCTSGSTLLLENISIKEASIIGENSNILKGVKVTSEWERKYTSDSEFKSILGKVTTKKQGLPETQLEKLLALDYSNDSRVGVSGIEAQYEDILKGTQSTSTISYDDDGNPIITDNNDGSNGSNIHLTIDWEIQSKLSSAVKSQLASHTGYDERFNNHIFVTLMDPNTGEIIAMVGYERSDGEIYSYDAGNYLNAYAIGSASKGATLYTGFKNNVITENTYIVDEPLYIKGTKVKKSHKTMGRINEVTALEQSSNVYMFKLAIKLAGGTYRANQPLDIDLSAFKTFRECFGELGLGVKSGLDVPNEELGYKGYNYQAGNLLDFAIGQYDTYTTIQLATYGSTIANDGVKVQPHLFKDSFTYDSDGNEVIESAFKTKIIDDVSEYTTAFKQIKKGFRACVTTGTGKSANNAYKPAGKTGTAEVYENSGDVDYPNHTFVGFAPYDDPQITVACISERQSHNESCKPLAKYAMEIYFEKYGVKDSN